MSITFTIGNKYVTRDGRTVTCTRKEFDTVSFEDANSCWLCVFTDTGKRYNNGRECNDDITSEYVESQSVKFDWTKPAQTKYGRKVLHLTLIPDPDCEYCLVGKLETNVFLSTWNKDGKAYANPDLDLINVPEKKVVPLEPGDIKPGCLIKQAYELDEPTWEIITGVVKCKHDKQGYYITTGTGKTLKITDHLYNFVISRDNGATWEKCEKEVMS